MADPMPACYKNMKLALFFQSVVEEVSFGKYILIISLNDKCRSVVACISLTKSSPNSMCKEREGGILCPVVSPSAHSNNI
jgi:hypothetical protein